MSTFFWCCIATFCFITLFERIHKRHKEEDKEENN